MKDVIVGTKSEPLKATLWMIGAMISFSLMAIAGRELANSLNTFEIMLYRSIIGLVIVVLVGASMGTLSQIKVNRFGLHLVHKFCPEK